MTRKTGTVKFFCDTRGYGFITPEDGGHDIFVHRTGLGESCRGDLGLTLVTDQRVTFALEEAPKGPKAVDVSIERPTNANRAAQ